MDRNYWLTRDSEYACPGHCEPAHSMENDGYWRCSCGTWKAVSEPPRMLVPDLACWNSQSQLGDRLLDQEAAEFDRLSAHEQRLRMLLEASKAREAAEKMARAAAASEIAKAQSIVCDRSGKLKRQVLRPCRYFNYKGVLGRAEPGGTNKRGVIWEAGCELHLKGCCEFIHPDQAEWRQFTQAAKRW